MRTATLNPAKPTAIPPFLAGYICLPRSACEEHGKCFGSRPRRHLGLDEIALLSGVNRDHFLRIFRQAGEVSPMRQVRRMELEQVVERLRSTRKSLEILAQDFSYADGSSLRRALRRSLAGGPMSSGRVRSPNRRAKVPISVPDNTVRRV